MVFTKCSFRYYLKLFVLSIAMVASSASAIVPLNDDFANATLLAGASGTTNASNLSATAEINEPNHGAFGTPAASIWYKWVAPNTDDVDFDTQGSDYDTALAVYTGTTLFK